MCVFFVDHMLFWISAYKRIQWSKNKSRNYIKLNWAWGVRVMFDNNTYDWWLFCFVTLTQKLLLFHIVADLNLIYKKLDKFIWIQCCSFLFKKTIVLVVIGDMYNYLNFLDPKELTNFKYISVFNTRRQWVTSLTWWTVQINKHIFRKLWLLVYNSLD